jgi:transposase-like protein
VRSETRRWEDLMGKTPKKHNGEFKFRVVVESIQINEAAEIVRRLGVHPASLTKWRQEFLK